MKRLSIIGLCLGLLSCGTVETDQNMPVQVKAEVARSPALLESYLSGNTIYQFVAPENGGHGVQVEYHAPDGRSYLWYPGNERPLQGWWEVRTANDQTARLCYRYGENTYNPVLHTTGGAWECGKESWVYLGVSVKGDVFGLKSGRLPYRLADREYHALDELYSRAGGNPTKLDYITNTGEL